MGGQTIRVALELELFSRLPGTLAELSEKLEVAPRGLRPFLNLLSSLKLLNEDGDRFTLAEGAEDFLRDEWPSKEKELVCPEDWRELAEAVRTGQCVRVPIEGEPDGGNFFSGIVDTLFRLHFGLANHVGQHLPKSIGRVLDLGAGSAVWSIGVLLHNPSARAVAVDMQKVLDEVTTRFVTDKDLAERYELRAGSYHTVELEAEHYDLVYLGHVIHSEGWDASRTLLRRCLETLKPGGLLAVSEWVGSDPRGADYHANLFDLNMLMFTEHGLVFDGPEMEGLLSEAGFEGLEWVKGPGQYPVLLGSKP